MDDIALSVVVVSFNTGGILGNCLTSVVKTLEGVPFELIVVDNASTDGSAEMVEREFPEVRLIKNSTNVGFAAANNQAIKNAHGTYLLILNSDALVREGCVEVLARFLDDHPLAAAAGPKILNIDGTLQNKGFCFPSIAGSLLFLSGAEKLIAAKTLNRLFPGFYWDENEVAEVDFLHGCCMLIRKDAIEATGGFSEDYFMYFEEQDWCWRARRKGYGVWYVPSAEVFHYGAASPLTNRSDVFSRSMLIFYRKNIGAIRGFAITLLQIFSTSLSLIRAFLAPRDEYDLGHVKTYLFQQVRLFKGILGLDRPAQ